MSKNYSFTKKLFFFFVLYPNFLDEQADSSDDSENEKRLFLGRFGTDEQCVQ